MNGSDRLRRLASYAFVAALVVAAISCNEAHPNSTLTPHTDLGREIDFLWDRLLLLGTIVFILVEVVLIYVVFRYRRRENQGTPPQTHGSTKLEIAWTLIPAVILVFIAVPTVRTIFITQAQAAPGSLEIDVTGHQWWWEFRYPDYGVTTANEIYLPVGRTVNFRLRSADVIHSFWAPELGGKRDVVTNRTNYIWYTPDTAYRRQRVERILCGVLRRVARQHALQGFHGDAATVRVVGGGTENAGAIWRSWSRRAHDRSHSAAT